jgi:hypothetical protein
MVIARPNERWPDKCDVEGGLYLKGKEPNPTSAPPSQRHGGATGLID